MKTIAFLQNKYYTDDGMQYVFRRLQEEFCKRDMKLVAVANIYASYPQEVPECDFGIFWDKDIALAQRLENSGLRLFNCARAIELCDDKRKTQEELSGKVEMPETVCAPLVYDVSSGKDDFFIEAVEKRLGYPVIVKENTGSQGRQVYMAKDRNELEKLHSELIHKPHIFQRFVRGEKVGSDIRVYLIGGRAVGAAERTNTTDFRSNVFLGGEMTRITLPGELIRKAETVAKVLGLEYGSADFICENGNYVFIEANSSVYMQSTEKLGIELASMFAEYVSEEVYGSAR